VLAFGRDGDKLWTLPSTEAYVESIPAVDGGTAFVPLHGAGLAALDLHTGQPRWLVPLAGATGSTRPLPLEDGDVAYAADGLARFGGGSGNEVWRLGGELRDAVAYSPLDADGGIIFGVLVSVDPTSANGERVSAVGVDAATGQLLWRTDMVGSAFAMGAAAGGGMVVVIDANNRAAVLDGRTGEERWSYQLDSTPAGRPVVHDGVVLFAETGRPDDLLQRDYRITAHDLGTGRFLGVYEPPSAPSATLPTVGSTSDGSLLVPTTDAVGGNVVVLEPTRD
jgi:outer membrane protein assembly factor BamB